MTIEEMEQRRVEVVAQIAATIYLTMQASNDYATPRQERVRRSVEIAREIWKESANA